MTPSLSRSYKNQYPFRIGTTSFIYPDNYTANVRQLGPFVDEIELLFFESRFENSLPSGSLIRELKHLAEMHAITYNVHLPTDVFLGHPDQTVRRHAVDTIRRFIDRTRPLAPTTRTLHLEPPPGLKGPAGRQRWQEALHLSMESIVDTVPAEDLSIETLMYPFQWIDSILHDFRFSVCIDVGHLILSGQNIDGIFDTWTDRLAILHLHGVRRGRDHAGLDHLPSALLQNLLMRLAGFAGTVSIEVFSFPDLEASLDRFDATWNIVNALKGNRP